MRDRLVSDRTCAGPCSGSVGSMIIKVLGALFSSLPAFPLSASLDPSIKSVVIGFPPPSRGAGIEQAACQTLRKREWRMNDSLGTQRGCGFRRAGRIPAVTGSAPGTERTGARNAERIYQPHAKWKYFSHHRHGGITNERDFRQGNSPARTEWHGTREIQRVSSIRLGMRESSINPSAR